MAQVSILLCTFRGAAHLTRQLHSIAAQTFQDWRLFVSDDGSDDGTLEILKAYAVRFGPERMQVLTGPGRGFARNFFSLIERSDIRAPYYAFCDQDDEWLPGKLTRSVAALARLSDGVPGLYGSRSELIDQHGRPMGLSRLYRREPSFANALVQNFASGNTMVLNHAAMALLQRAGGSVDVSAHDWWAYLLVTGAGGAVIYDPRPTIRYRQHGNNLYGANHSLSAARVRVQKLLAGDFRRWNQLNVAALRRCESLLTETHRQQLAAFEAACEGQPLQRLANLVRSGVYRQTLDGQLGLWVAALSNRL